MRNLLIVTAALLVTAGTPAVGRQSARDRGSAELAKELEGLVPGPPEKCLTLSRIIGSHIIDNTAIVYRTLGGRIYVNRTLGPELLREYDIPVQFVYGAQLCRLDRIQLLDRTSRMRRGSVGLDNFIPYSKPGKTR